MGRIHPKLAINTKSIKHDCKTYCAYCGKEIEKDSEWDHGEEIKWYHCDCADALNEIELTQKLISLREVEYCVSVDIKKLRETAKYKLVTKTIIEKID